jgi:hypothetical protein
VISESCIGALEGISCLERQVCFGVWAFGHSVIMGGDMEEEGSHCICIALCGREECLIRGSGMLLSTRAVEV